MITDTDVRLLADTIDERLQDIDDKTEFALALMECAVRHVVRLELKRNGGLANLSLGITLLCTALATFSANQAKRQGMFT